MIVGETQAMARQHVNMPASMPHLYHIEYLEGIHFVHGIGTCTAFIKQNKLNTTLQPSHRVSQHDGTEPDQYRVMWTSEAIFLNNV